MIFLKEYDEDIQVFIDSGYREYEFFERGSAEEVAIVEQLCGVAAKQDLTGAEHRD